MRTVDTYKQMNVAVGLLQSSSLQSWPKFMIHLLFKGISVNYSAIKISQYADEITLILKRH